MSSQEGQYLIGQQEDSLKLFELRTVETCLGYLLSTLESLPPTFSFLDVGCGPGSITMDLARRFPQAKIIGVDQAQEAIDRASAKAKTIREDTGIEFRHGDILKPETFLSAEEMGSFDVVQEHTTLTCIPQPNNVEILGMMKKLAKQNGGIVACRNHDISSQTMWPPCVENTALHERIYHARGLDPYTGRKLINMALSVGFGKDQIRASASVLSNIAKSERQAYAVSMIALFDNENSEYRKMVDGLGYTAQDVATLRSNLVRFMEADDGCRMVICGEIICTLG